MSINPSTWRWLVRFLCLVLLGAIGYLGFSQLYLPAKFKEVNKVEKALVFEIRKGEPLASVASRLEQAGLIPDTFVFLKLLERENLDTKIQAGFFAFEGKESLQEVAQKLLHGASKEIKLRIPEGFNAKQIDKLLTERGLIEAGAFRKLVQTGLSDLPAILSTRVNQNLEGYLFPDTYFLNLQSFTSEVLVRKMLTALANKLAAAGFQGSRSDLSLHEVLTLASIVELEEPNPRNKPLVADILLRRWKSGGLLGADATLFYVLGHRQNLTRQDLEVNSPYNTRKFRGLPPTPVCAPGLSSLQAVLNPQPNEFWYYLHDRTGQIHFGRNLAEHNRNKAEFLN